MLERFGEKMLRLRKRHRMTLQQLADALGYMGTGYLSRVETGHRRPSIELAIKMAALFRVSVDQLVLDDLELPDAE